MTKDINEKNPNLSEETKKMIEKINRIKEFSKDNSNELTK